ncbi:MAG: hypothetical protein HY959_11190 [Ignavibacteriae bacterium]|nr:hypothetical protein [Ignavibacteriota bacterium]
MNSNVKILFKTFFKLEFRDNENSAKKKFIGVVISYLFANAVLSLNSFLSFEKTGYELLAFSTGVFLLVFVVLSDFSNIFFTKRHIDAVNPLPVSVSELVTAKYAAAFAYLAVFAAVIIIPQTAFYFFYEKNIYGTLMFAAVNVSSLFLLTGIFLFLYTICVRLFSEKAGFLLYFLQFIFFFYVIYISSHISKKATVRSDIMASEYIKYFPQYYFTFAVDNALWFLMLLLLTVLVYASYYYYLKKNYNLLSAVIYDLKDKKKKEKEKKNIYTGYNNFICSKFISNNEEKASYMLTVNQLRSSKSLKMKFIPLAFIPLIVTMIAVITGALLFEPGGEGSVQILTPSFFFTLLMCIKLLVSATKIEDENSQGAAWAFSVLPVSSLKRVINANIKFVYANFIFPVVLLLSLILIFKIPTLALLCNMVFVLTSSYFIISVFFLFDKIAPYSLENSRYNSVSKLGEILLIMLVGIVIFVSQIFIFENVIFVGISVLAFLIVSAFLKKRQFTLKSN